MKRVIVPTGSCINIEAKEGEYIEEKVRRIVENGEPIEDGAPIIYTERKDGIRPEFNIRTDRWDIALDAMNTVNESKGKLIAMKIAKKDGTPESQPSQTKEQS